MRGSLFCCPYLPKLLLFLTCSLNSREVVIFNIKLGTVDKKDVVAIRAFLICVTDSLFNFPKTYLPN